MNVKKVSAIILAVVMATGMAIPAYGDTDDFAGSFSTDGKGSFSLSDDSICTTENEILFGSAKVVNGQIPFEDYAKQYTPNIVSALRTYDIKNSVKVNLEADRCGVAVEQSTTDKLEISHIGTKSGASEINSDVTVKADGTVNISAKGISTLKYVNTDPNDRVNVVLIKIPKHIKTLTVDVGVGILIATDFAGAINGETDNGSIKIIGDKLNYGYDLECDNGTIRLDGNTVGGKVSLETKNGSIKIFGKTVSGDINMHSDNGKVTISADSLGGAVMKTKNGKIELDVGTFTGDVNATIDNGKLLMNVRKKPVNLALAFGNVKCTLPSAWNGQTVFGTGTPKISLLCGNGQAEVTSSAVPTWDDAAVPQKPAPKLAPKDKAKDKDNNKG